MQFRKTKAAAEQSALAEQSDPCIRAHEHIDPHRDRDREHEDVLQLFAASGDKERYRIAEQQADHGRLKCDEQGTPQDDQKVRVGKKFGVMLKREGEGYDCVSLFGKGIQCNQAHRKNEHHHCPRDVRDNQL